MKHDYDWNEVGTLLHIIEKLQGYPKLANMLKAAMEQLQTINDGPNERENQKLPKDITPATGPANALTQLPDGGVVQKPSIAEQQPPIESVPRDAAGNIIVPRQGAVGAVQPTRDPILDRPTTLINEPTEPTIERRV